MGYVARTISAQDVKNGVFLTIPIVVQRTKDAGFTLIEVYKLTVDFTGIDYLYYKYTVKDNAIANTNNELKIGGISKVDNNDTHDGVSFNGEIDCTAINGDQAITLEIQATAGGAALSWITNLSFFCREA